VRRRRPPPPPPVPPWRGEAGLRWGAVAMVVLALLLYWSGHRPPPSSPGAVVLRSASAPPGAPAARMQPAPAAAPGSLPAAQPTPPVAPAIPRRAVGPGVEVCGWGTVELPEDDPFPLQRIPAAQRAAALDAAEQRLLADADPRVQAAGLLIGTRGRGQGGRQRIERLAWLAAGLQDPVVYALALRACQGVVDRDGGACRLLSRTQAARLEPDNAQPWLELAAEAAAQGDAAAEHDAMARAAQTTRSDVHFLQLPALVSRALAPPVPALQRTLASSVAINLHDTWRLSPAASAQARDYCAAGVDASAAEPSRQAGCRALARVLGDQGRSLAELATALAIARSAQLPGSGPPAWQLEHDALVEVGTPESADPNDLGCAALTAAQGWWQRVADDGERRALRERLEASGRSLQEGSERHRRNLGVAGAAVAEAAVADGAGDQGR
jgi:hypothetical protein